MTIAAAGGQPSVVHRSKFASWITVKRLRAHGLMLALCLWSVYMWNMASPGLFDHAGNLKGTDFLHFYTLGSVALAHRGADLYNSQAQSAIALTRVPGTERIQFLPLYPPQVSLFFAPLALLSYSQALAVWLAVSVVSYGICCYIIWRVCPRLHNEHLTVLVIALAFPPIWHLIAWGQTSALALICFALAYLALKSGNDFLAGLCFGCLIFKPQLALAAAIIFVITSRWKVIAGALLAAVAQLTAAWFYYGLGPLREWTRVLLHTPKQLPLLEPRPYQTHCLRSFWSMLVPWPSPATTLYVCSALVVAALIVSSWKSRLPLSMRFSALLCGTVLLAPHLTVYDLVILAPVFLLSSDWIGTHPDDPAVQNLKLLLYLAYVLPLLGPLARWTHLQLSVPIMTLLLYAIWKSGKDLRAPSVRLSTAQTGTAELPEIAPPTPTRCARRLL